MNALEFTEEFWRVNFSPHHCKHSVDILNGGLHVDTKSSHDDLHCTYVALSISIIDPVIPEIQEPTNLTNLKEIIIIQNWWCSKVWTETSGRGTCGL